MVAELGRPGMDIVTAQSFQMVGKVTAGTSSEEETSKEKFEDEKQKEEDSVASFPAALNNVVDHAGSSNESADICRTNAQMKTMNRLDELSREAENCWAWMKATYLDDEKWYRVYDETSMEDSIAPWTATMFRGRTCWSRRSLSWRRRIISGESWKMMMIEIRAEIVLVTRISAGASGFGSETVDEKKECEGIDDDEQKSLTTSARVQSEEQALVTCQREVEHSCQESRKT